MDGLRNAAGILETLACTFVNLPTTSEYVTTLIRDKIEQEAQLSPRNRAMRLVSSNLANYHATVQKLLIRQVLTKPMV